MTASDVLDGRVTATGEIRRDWRVLAGSTLGNAVGVQSAPYYVSGVFIAALESDLGWSRTALSVGPALLIAGTAVMVPVTGRLADRLGEKRLIFPSMVLMALCLIALGNMPAQIGLWYGLMGGMAMLGAGASSPVFSRLISRTFVNARGTALAISISGTALVATLAPPLIERIIAHGGWRSGYLALAALVLATLPLVYGLLRGPTGPVRSPAAATDDRQRVPYGRLLRDPIFLRLSISGFLVALASGGLVIHFVPMLIAGGMTSATAAYYAALIGIVLFVARLATGILMDIVEAKHVAIAITIASAVGYLMFALGGSAFVLAGVIACGLSVGAEYDIMSYLTARFYPVRAFGQVFGVIFAVIITGSAVSTITLAYLSTEYGYGFTLFLASGMMAMASFLLINLPRCRDRAESPFAVDRVQKGKHA